VNALDSLNSIKSPKKNVCPPLSICISSLSTASVNTLLK